MKKAIFLIFLVLITCFLMFADNRLQELSKIFEFSANLATYDDFYRYMESRKGISRIEFMRESKNTEGQVLIISEADIYLQCGDKIDRYINDIESNLSYGTIFYTVTKAVTPEEIKDIMILHYYNDEIEGAVLIGDVATAWYEIANDFNQYGYADFPIDLFYMDLDGIWIDSNANGKYDIHQGHVNPEIFIGRINTSTMGLLGSEEELLNKYLDRNHEYWQGNIDITGRIGLSYTDHDWINSFDLKSDIIYLYGPDKYAMMEYNDGVFSRSDYLDRLGMDTYGMVQFACHSSWNTHYLHYEMPIYSAQIFHVPPESLSYNLFNCSGCRWTAPTANDHGFLGGVYVYNHGSNTLFAVGSAKTGSMLGFSHYYFSLGKANINGIAFLEWWWNYIGETHEFWEICWFYGMTIVGCPMIRLTTESNWGNFAMGDGSEQSPFIVEDHNQLFSLRLFQNAYFKQGADIIFSAPSPDHESQWIPIGNGTMPWQGHYDGNGHRIKNLKINAPNTGYQGVWGRVENSTLKNIIVDKAEITGGVFTGGIAGFLQDSIIENSRTINSAINGSTATGGLTGVLRYSAVFNSYNDSEITGSQDRTGGITGGMLTSTITDSYNTGKISGNTAVGGITGQSAHSGTVSKCYSTGIITGNSHTGGIIGYQQGDPSQVINSYWNINTSGQTFSDGGEARTTAQMTYPYFLTYMDWDFDNTWIGDYKYDLNDGYPYLRSFLPFKTSMSYFNAFASGTTASLTWKTLSEENIDHFLLYRISIKKLNPLFSFIPVLVTSSPVIASGGLNTTAEYHYYDEVLPNENLIYILESVSYCGLTEKWEAGLIWQRKNIRGLTPCVIL